MLLHWHRLDLGGEPGLLRAWAAGGRGVVALALARAVDDVEALVEVLAPVAHQARAQAGAEDLRRTKGGECQGRVNSEYGESRRMAKLQICTEQGLHIQRCTHT